MSEEKEEGEKKSFFKKLGNLFYESDGTVAVSEPQKSSEQSVAGVFPANNGTFPANSAAQYTTVAPINIPSTGDGIFDQKFNEAFQKIISDNNMPGIDYFEFRQVLDNMSSVAGLNEAVSYQTAYTTLKIGDPTFDKLKLVSSIEFYDKLLASEESEFNAELSSESQKRVVSQRERANELNAENLEIVKQIQSLNEKIASNQQEAITINSEAGVSEANIGQTSKNFTKTMSHVRAKLEEDKQKINTLIQ